MKTSIEDKLKISGFAAVCSALISMTPISGYISGAIGGQETVMVGVMAFIGTGSGLVAMDLLNM
jgi:hypothetical protein